MKYITCKNLKIGYEKNIIAEEIEFEICSGDYICVVGENGVGKSTLVKTILNLQPPLSGSVVYENGISQREIGYIPQQTLIQRDFPASVYEIVLSGNLPQNNLIPFYKKEHRKAAENYMKKLNIWELKERSYQKLSGGQQQRVLLARTLCATDKLLIADEPITGLDANRKEEYYSLLKQLNKQGLTIFMITHELKEAMKYADKILHLGKKQIFFGEKERYRHHPVSRLLLRKEDL